MGLCAVMEQWHRNAALRPTAAPNAKPFCFRHLPNIFASPSVVALQLLCWLRTRKVPVRDGHMEEIAMTLGNTAHKAVWG